LIATTSHERRLVLKCCTRVGTRRAKPLLDVCPKKKDDEKETRWIVVEAGKEEGGGKEGRVAQEHRPRRKGGRPKKRE